MSSEKNDEPQGTEQRQDIGRRPVLLRLLLALGAIGAGLVALPVVGFLVAPLLERLPTIWRTVGAIDDFRIGETVEVSFQDASPLPWAGLTARTAAWVRRQSETEFIAFSVNCTHLGCPVRWLPDANLFMCPCHGGVYYSDGQVASGPPPRSLVRYPVRIGGGKLQIRATAAPIT